MGPSLGILFLTMALLLPSAALAQVPGPDGGAALERATQQLLPVIVQKADRSGRAEALVADLGGRITKDLNLINAFAAEVPRGVLDELAASPCVSRVTPDVPVESAGKPTPPTPTASAPRNYFRDTMGVSNLGGLTGAGIGVAVIDSGIDNHADFYLNAGGGRLGVSKTFNPASTSAQDYYGHGTHVAGIIGADGEESGGLFTGVAPGATLFGLKIADDQGNARESDVVAALQWVYDNKAKNNIRVVNLSVNSAATQSYHESPLDAACEVLWFNGVVVVASAGNKGPAGDSNTVSAAPANDPFIITVGAVDEHGTASRSDDSPAPYSASGTTSDGFLKPDVLAPGTSIYSTLSSKSSWAADYPERTQFNNKYFRLSGTSMAAPMVAGVVALLLQDEPALTPDQVKYRLLNSGVPYVKLSKRGEVLETVPYADAYAAVKGTTAQSANTGIPASRLLWSGTEPVMWNSVMWNSVMWNSVMWNSVMWNSVMWNSVMWNSVNWQ